MGEFDGLAEQFGVSRFDPAKAERQRERARKRWLAPSPHAHRVEHRAPPPEDEGEDESPKSGRIPSSAIACSARYRERYVMSEVTALLKAMPPIEAKEACVQVLKDLGFTIVLRTAPGKKRDRSKEIAARSAMRAKVRAEKAAKRASPNGALPAMET